MGILTDILGVDDIEGLLNLYSKTDRERDYRKRLAEGGPVIKIVSEGDSWFQFPLILKDIIDHLADEENFAILSLGTAGDRMADYIEQNEYLPAILEENPDFFLLSGGGNDMVGSGALRERIRPFDASFSAEDYLNEKFDAAVQGVMDVYTKIFDDVSTATSHTQIICHGYDYLSPKGQRYLGEPMSDLGIEDKDLQQEISKQIADRFNAALKTTVEPFTQVHYLDLRGTLSKFDWFDENHPWDWGYEKLAEKFKQKINSLHTG